MSLAWTIGPFAHPHYKAFQPRGAAGTQFTGLSPVTVANLYGFPPGDGTGQTIGIIELGGGFRPSDLETYFSLMGVPNPTVLVASADQGANSPGADADLEVGLDIEIVGAIVPKAKSSSTLPPPRVMLISPTPSWTRFMIRPTTHRSFLSVGVARRMAQPGSLSRMSRVRLRMRCFWASRSWLRRAAMALPT